MRGQTASTRRRRHGSDPADGVLPPLGVGRLQIGRRQAGSSRHEGRPSAGRRYPICGRSPTGGSRPGAKPLAASNPGRLPHAEATQALYKATQALRKATQALHKAATRVSHTAATYLMQLASDAVGRGFYRKVPANRISRRPSASARSNRPPHPVSVQSHRERSTWT